MCTASQREAGAERRGRRRSRGSSAAATGATRSAWRRLEEVLGDGELLVGRQVAVFGQGAPGPLLGLRIGPQRPELRPRPTCRRWTGRAPARRRCRRRTGRPERPAAATSDQRSSRSMTNPSGKSVPTRQPVSSSASSLALIRLRAAVSCASEPGAAAASSRCGQRGQTGPVAPAAGRPASRCRPRRGRRTGTGRPRSARRGSTASAGSRMSRACAGTEIGRPNAVADRVVENGAGQAVGYPGQQAEPTLSASCRTGCRAQVSSRASATTSAVAGSTCSARCWRRPVAPAPCVVNRAVGSEAGQGHRSAAAGSRPGRPGPAQRCPSATVGGDGVQPGGLQPLLGPGGQILRAGLGPGVQQVGQAGVAEPVPGEVLAQPGQEHVIAEVGGQLTQRRSTLGVGDAVELGQRRGGGGRTVAGHRMGGRATGRPRRPSPCG